MKICTKCKQEKDEKEFYKNRARKGGLCQYCKTCEKERNTSDKMKVYHKLRYKNDPTPQKYAMIKTTYGISKEEYFKIRELQADKCAICSIRLDSLPSKQICIDHCHNTNKIRGILCDSCNKLLGNAKDNTAILKQAISYLKI